MTDFARDLHAIQNLKAHYCRTADLAARDPDRARQNFSEIFSDDFVGDYGFETMHGRDAIVDFLCTVIAGNSEWLIHMLHSPRIEIGDNRAVGEWAVSVHLKRKATGAIDLVIGRYADEFIRIDNAWRISIVRFSRLT